MQVSLDISEDTPEQLQELVDFWLWGFSEPLNWPSRSDARLMISALVARDDAHHPMIREAVADCLEYIRLLSDG
jgi:hypothetical protein